jgi:hypothetical protein
MAIELADSTAGFEWDIVERSFDVLRMISTASEHCEIALCVVLERRRQKIRLHITSFDEVRHSLSDIRETKIYIGWDGIGGYVGLEVDRRHSDCFRIIKIM